MPMRGGILGRFEIGGPFEAQRILLGSDFNIVGVDTRHRDLEHKAFSGLVQIRVCATPIAETSARNKAILKQTIHCPAQRNDLVKRIVAYNACHDFSLLEYTIYCLPASSLFSVERDAVVFLFCG